MIYLIIYLVLFVCTFALMIWFAHERSRATFRPDTFLGIKLAYPIGQLLLVSLLLAPIVGPISPIVVIKQLFNRIYYRNRPQPLKKKIDGFAGRGFVLDRTGVMPLVDYNRKYKTNFTLEQVYGKKFAEKIRIKEQETMAKKAAQKVLVKTELEDGLPNNLHTEICKTFVNAFQTNNFSIFEKYLSKETELVRYDKGIEQGADDIITYFKNQHERFRDSQVDHIIQMSPFFNVPIVKQHFYNEGFLYVVFRIEEGQITHIIYTPGPSKPYILRNSLEMAPFDYQYIKDGIVKEVEPQKYHYPCMVCGKPSNELKWYRFNTHDGKAYEYAGLLSVCPDCKRQAEFAADIRCRMM